MPYQRGATGRSANNFLVPNKTFFSNFGEHLLLKNLVEALGGRLPPLPRPLVAAAASSHGRSRGFSVVLGAKFGFWDKAKRRWCRSAPDARAFSTSCLL